VSQLVIDASLTLGWLTGYDAAYLELAMRLKLPLATNDKALLRAAAACGVPLVQP